MTEYELADMTSAGMSNFLTTFSVFLSVVTAYIVAAFVVGTRLTSLQLFIVNCSFLISASILGYLVRSNFKIFYIFASANPDGPVAQSAIRPSLIDFSWPLSILLVIILLGSLVFMYSVRKPTTNSKKEP